MVFDTELFIAWINFYNKHYLDSGQSSNRDVLFEFHLKFGNTANISIPVKSLL